MIAFYGDKLVPFELCRLLYHAVPRRDHVPVRFFNRHDAYGNTTREKPRGYSTPYGIFVHGKRPWVGINLNAVYFEAAEDLYSHLAPSTAVWRALLNVCLHEFGHSATRETSERLNRHEYGAEPWGRVFRYTELMADEWQDRRAERILRHDARLGQPRRITGYLGARLAERRSSIKRWIEEPGNEPLSGSLRAAYVKEQRCWKSGAQLTSGDVLHEMGLNHRLFTNAYGVLRVASDGVGVCHTDGAGRRHKLYAWGDVPVLRRRVEERFGKLVFRHGSGCPAERDGSEAGHGHDALMDGRRIRARLLVDESYIPF